MAASPDSTPPTRATPRWVWLAAAALLALYAVLTLTASMGKGVSFDEGEELAVGYDIWLHHDFRMEGANGDFVKRWATLPFLISQPAFPGTDTTDWRNAQPYVLGYRFLFSSGNEPPHLLWQGRTMVALLGVATALLVFYCSMEVFGDLGGLFALALFVFSPDMLAFGGVVSTEMSLCLTLLGATWCIWRLLHRVTWARVLASLGFVGLLFLAKASALVIFPITAVLVAVKLFSGRPLDWRLGRSRVIQSRAAQAGVFLGLFIVHGVWCWLCLWAHYDFRYAASPDAANPAISAWDHQGKSPVNPAMATVLSWSRRTHALPEGYLDGMELLLSDNELRVTFMNGAWSVGRTPAFYPYAFWAKTPPALWLLPILGMSWWLWHRNRFVRRKKFAAPARAMWWPVLYKTVPYIALVTVFGVVAVAQHLDIAHRHILPIYPSLDILAGGAAGWLWLRRERWMKVVIALLMFWYAGDSLAIYPNYLAYFSPVVGGPEHGYQRLAESSLDWGMDLPSLKHWVDQHEVDNREPFYLAYFGTDNPDFYGIKSTRLPSYPAWEAEGVYDLNPGVYAISATILQGFYTDPRGPWNPVYEAAYQGCIQSLKIFNETAQNPDQRAALLKKYPEPLWSHIYGNFKKLRFGRLCTWLRHHRKPDDNVGHSILIWRLNQADLDDALNGTPAEMENAPLWTQIQEKS
jgi:hypothetical protein